MIKMSQNLLESLIVLCELCLDGDERLIHRLETPIEHFETPVDRLETKGDLFELPAPGILCAAGIRRWSPFGYPSPGAG